MDDRKKQFRVGVVVFATMIVASILILMNSDFSWSPFREQYQLQVLVDQAPGVAPDTPVRRRGILIGRVAAVEDIDDGALITINIDAEKHVKSNEQARVQTSLIGDAVIEFSPEHSAQGAQIVQPGGPPLRGMYNPSPLDLIANLQGDLKQTIISLGDAGEEVAKLADQLNTVLGDQDVERLSRLVSSLEVAVGEFGEVMSNVNDVIGDEEFKVQLKDGLAKLPKVIEDANEILRVLEVAVGSADQNLKNLQGLTEPLGKRGPQIVNSIETGVSNLSELLGEFALLAKNVNNSDGTIGKLINDDSLYRQLAATVSQASGAVQDIRMLINDRDIRLRIRQILDDIRVFADKIARDPARVARGVVPGNRELPIK
ncbi:MAG: MCE family protein [Planctomycetales bacterium]|nr:MCE family protein [Planctomycetales bacterium]